MFCICRMFVRGDECRSYGQVILSSTDDYTFLPRFLCLKVIQANSLIALVIVI